MRSLDIPAASVLTLVRDRQTQLENLLIGLARQSEPNVELVIASMQPEPPRVPGNCRFPIRVVAVPNSVDLPLAAARNLAAAGATSDNLIFLDVDCIPSPMLVRSYGQALLESDRCFLGEVRYLPKLDSLDAANFAGLWEQARIHPARPLVPQSGWRAETDPRALWGLSFAIRSQRYWAVDGMDEHFTGYGGEETDFAERLAAVDTGFAWLADAHAVHQWHAVCTPPLDKFESIVSNARRFHDRWGNWCMEFWLASFAKEGYIEWSPTSENLRIHHFPKDDAIEKARQPDHVCFA